MLFLGREKEIGDLTMWLDLHSDDVRVVSIVGPSGIGKSSLAIQVGHQMIDKGAVVNYVDVSLVDLDGLPDQLLQNTGIFVGRNSSQRLLQWLRREMKHTLVIILDNCDMILAADRTRFYYFLDEMFSSSTTTMKVIVTSRKTVKPIHHSEHFIDYPIGEIRPGASCQLLRTTSMRALSVSTCKSIIKHTGNIPLSLELVGNILVSQETNISKVISSLEKEMGTASSTLVEKRVNASAQVSLIYLKHKLINLGQYLSFFPASFSVTDACSVLSPFLNEDCAWIDKLRQRGLLYDCGDNRYQFRHIVREQFVRKRNEKEIVENEFWSEYLRHFSDLLRQRSLEFQESPRNVLLIEVEKQDMRNFLGNAIDCCEALSNLHIQVLETIKIAIDTEYLMSFYADRDLVHLLQNSLMCLKSTMGNAVTSRMSLYRDAEANVVDLYIYFTSFLVDLKSEEAGLVFEQAQVWLDRRIDGANISLVETFYLKLSNHYSKLGMLQEETNCHVTILKRISDLNICYRGACGHQDISEAYYSLGKYELSAYFQTLYIKHSNLSALQLTAALLRLHTCQIKLGNFVEANDTAQNILELSTRLITAGSMEIYGSLALFSDITIVFRLHNWTKEAKDIERKIFAALREASYANLEVEEVVKTVFALARSLFREKQYETVSEVAQYALNIVKKGNDSSTTYSNEAAAFYLLVGKAELYNRRRRASLTSLGILMDYYYRDPTLVRYARDACKAMLVQTHVEMACFYIAFEETMILANSIYEFVKSDTFDVQQFPTSYMYVFPVEVPNGILDDDIADVPLVSFYVVFFIKWQIVNIRYLLSARFVVQVLNLVFILVKLTLVVSVAISPIFFIYGCINYTKLVYRTLWNSAWSSYYLD